MKKYVNDLKLSTKITAFITLILLFSLFLINAVLIKSYYNTLIRKEKEKGNEITRMFAQLSVNPLYRQDYYTLESNVIQLQKSPSILSARVYDNTGIIVTPSSNEVANKKNNFIIIQEDLTIDKIVIGKVEVIIDLSDSVQQARIYQLKMFLSSLMIVILVLILLYYLIRLIVLKPLTNVINSVSSISEGNLDQQIPIYSNDEIGILSKDFNQMTLTLKNNISITKSILESMPGLLIATNNSYKILKWNSQVSRFFDVKADLNESILWDSIPFFNKYKEICNEVLKNNTPIRLHRESYINKPDQFFEIFLFPLVIDQEQGLVISMDDVTETEKKDAQLRQAQKMDTIGTLAGGLAHDFNNILCGIIGTLSLFKHKLYHSASFSIEEAKRYTQTIEDATNRAEDLVQQFLSLSRKHEIHVSKIDLNQSLKHVSKISSNTFDKSVSIDVQYFPEPALTLADQTQIEQVILNLCINAYHSMTIMRPDNQGGVLRLSLEKINADKYFIRTHPEAMEINYWKISVSDTGIGISKENLQKIFDPFFTTKAKDKGTGLGLTMVYNIIKQHNGFIEIFSELNAGTNMVVYLPHLATENAIILLKEEKELIYKGNQETVLIVDDEAVILQIAKDILLESNYQVLCASDGIEALDIYKDKMNDIKLVVLDMLMPKKSGRDTFIELKALNPEVKVLLCSGFKKDERVEEIMSLGINHFIQKPYTLHKLSKMVYDILKGNSSQ